MSQQIKHEATLTKVVANTETTFIRVVKDGKSRMIRFPLYKAVLTIPAKTETKITHNKEVEATSAYYEDDKGYRQPLLVRPDPTDINSVFVYSAIQITNKLIIIKFI